MQGRVTLRDHLSHVFPLSFSSVEIDKTKKQKQNKTKGQRLSEFRLHFKWHRPKIQTAVHSWDVPTRQLSASSLFRFSCGVQDEL